VEYNPATEQCCGNDKYTIATHYCHTDGSTYSCGNKPYNPATQFCYNSSSGKVGSFCGINPQKLYDPDLYECKDGKNGIYLKAGIADSRDSKTYDAVLIGSQIWMAQNLNYRTADAASRCYPVSGNGNNSDADNVRCATYGRLYKWATAMVLDESCNSNSCASSINAKHKGVCPAGWHIPSDAEWTTLTDFAGGSSTAGTKLKAASGWAGGGSGTDDYGFAALPGGYGYPFGDFRNAGS
jgi:uncharacterized protein (TIGR02145 family)